MLDANQTEALGLPEVDALSLVSRAMVSAYQEMLSALEDVGDGGIALQAWEDFGWDSDPDDENVARLAMVAAFAPGMVSIWHRLFSADYLTEEELATAPDEELEDADIALRKLEILISSPEYSEFRDQLHQGEPHRGTDNVVAPFAQFKWAVRGAGTEWAGQIALWPFNHQYCVVTANWETIDYPERPVLLGFAQVTNRHRSAARVVQRTLGPFVSASAEVSGYTGFTDFEATFIATALGAGSLDWTNAVDNLSDSEIQDSFEEGLRRLEAIDEERRFAEERQTQLMAMVDRFSRTMKARRAAATPHVVPNLPLGKRIDVLSTEEVKAINAWLGAGTSSSDLPFRWESNWSIPVRWGRTYRGPAVVWSSGRAVRFPQATEPPTLGEVIDLGRATKPHRDGRTDLAYADALWSEGFHEEAEALYNKVATDWLPPIKEAISRYTVSGKPFYSDTSMKQERAQIAVSGHYIESGDFARGESLLLNLLDRCQAKRQAASNLITQVQREAMFKAAFEVERDVQNALAVLYASAKNWPAARSSHARWQKLTEELGEGPDVFALL